MSGVVDPDSLIDAAGLLDPTQRQFAEVTRRYLDDEVRPHLAAWFEGGHLPVRTLARDLGGLGVLGMQLDGYGCAGADPVSYGAVAVELEAADSGLRSLVSVTGSLVMFALRTFGSDEQREQWLPALARGDAVGCFGLTEPDAGSDPAALRTAARSLPGGDWALTGRKMWITNGSVADCAVVWARTDEGIRAFAVPMDTPGMSAHDVPRKMSLRASVTSELVLDDVRLPAGALLPGTTGLGSALACLNEARFGIIFGVMGAARDCLATALAYARERQAFGRPIGGFQLQQRSLVEMASAYTTGLLLAHRLGTLKAAGGLRPEQVSLGKFTNVSAALGIARQARAILGGSGITLDYPVVRHLLNLESVLTYEGTHDIHTLVVGAALTGERAFS